MSDGNDINISQMIVIARHRIILKLSREVFQVFLIINKE